MVDIEQNYNKKSRGLNLLNHLFKKRSKRNLNEMVKCLSGNSNDKLDQLLSKSLTNVNEMSTVCDNQNDNRNDNQERNRETKLNQNEPFAPNQLELMNYDEIARRRLSTPIIASNTQTNYLDRRFICKKLSLKARRSFSPKSKLIINHQNINHKKLSLDQELLEHYNQLSTECNSSYMSLISNSPISPRIKSIDEDIEALTLSRQDNPYIQNKLEKLSQYSGVNYDILSISNLSLNNGNFVNSTNTLNHQSHSNVQFSQANKASSISSEELDEILNFSKSNKDENLHSYLIRSPPPEFPLNFTSFISPAIGSPLRSLSMKYNHNSLNSNDTTSIKTPNLFLSPVHKQKSNQSPKKKDNLFFTNLTKKRLKNLNKSNESQLSTNENDVELIITS